jgi:hypothetical protein
VSAQTAATPGTPALGSHGGDALQRGNAQQAGNANGSPTAKLPDAPAPQPQTKPQLPDAPSEAVRLTPHQKFETFVKRTYSPYTFASAAFSATWAQMWGDYYGYGGGMQGWGKRFGASVANAEVRSFFSSFALPVVFRQDPRYHPSRKHGLFPRAWYAGTRVVVARSDNGNEMFNYSEVLGVLFTSSIQNSYYPRRDRGLDETMQRFVGGIGSDATSNLLREFSPEIKKIARKIVPKRAQKLEEKIPEPVKQGVGIAMAN